MTNEEQSSVKVVDSIMANYNVNAKQGYDFKQLNATSSKELNELYRTSEIAQNIIDIPSEDMVRAGWTFKCNNNKLANLIESRYRQLNLKHKFERLFKFSYLYGGAYMALGVAENDPSGETNNFGEVDLSKKLDYQNKNIALNYINVFSINKISKTKVNEDVFSSDYMENKAYFVKRKQTEAVYNNVLETEEEIHASRILEQVNEMLEDEERPRSILSDKQNIIRVLGLSLTSVGKIVRDLHFKVYKADQVSVLDNDVRDVLQTFAEYSTETGDMMLIDKDEDINRQSANVSGVNDLFNFLWNYLSGAVHIPKSILIGQETGKVAGAEYDLVNYYARIGALQESHLRPKLEYITRLLIAEQGLDPDEVDWEIEFNSLWKPDAKEAAETQLIQAQADQLYYDMNVLTPDDILNSRFDKTGMLDANTQSADSLTDEEIKEFMNEEHESEKLTLFQKFMQKLGW